MAAFLKAFDCSNPVELHDYAVARYLLDLGLRDDEVAHLTLQLVDWRNSTLTLGTSKSECVQKLPLPVPTGGAIARYLRQGRPTNRNPFVRHRASADIPLSVAAIRNSMNRASIRCGLRDQLCNTHVCAVPRRPVCSAQGVDQVRCTTEASRRPAPTPVSAWRVCAPSHCSGPGVAHEDADLLNVALRGIFGASARPRTQADE